MKEAKKVHENEARVSEVRMRRQGQTDMIWSRRRRRRLSVGE